VSYGVLTALESTLTNPVDVERAVLCPQSPVLICLKHIIVSHPPLRPLAFALTIQFSKVAAQRPLSDTTWFRSYTAHLWTILLCSGMHGGVFPALAEHIEGLHRQHLLQFVSMVAASIEPPFSLQFADHFRHFLGLFASVDIKSEIERSSRSGSLSAAMVEFLQTL
jgi:hypothetical protein